MVEARRNADKVEERHDLFSGLLEAAEGELDSEAARSDEELTGRHLNSQSLTFYEVFFPRKYVYISSCWT